MTQIKLTEMNTTMYEIKSTLDWINRRLDIAGEKLKEFEDTVMETI